MSFVNKRLSQRRVMSERSWNEKSTLRSETTITECLWLTSKDLTCRRTVRQSGGAHEGCGAHLSNTASLSKPRCRWSIEQTARVITAVPTSTWFFPISVRTKCQGAFSARKRTCNRQEEQINRKPKEGDECLTASARSFS